MNLNVIKGIVILAIGLFSFLNVYQFQVKSNENIFSYNALLQVKELINGPAYGEGSSEDFPEDPFKVKVIVDQSIWREKNYNIMNMNMKIYIKK